MTSTDELVAQARKNALELMKKAGYDIGNSLQVVVDPKLPFMGYTVPINGSYKTVVAGGAVDSGMLEGLLLHEMSHIYRMQNKHPSHDPKIIQEVIDSLGKETQSRKYQREIIGNLVNNIEDLYADDILTEVMRESRLYKPEVMTNFRQESVEAKAVKIRDARRERWVNASIMVDNARAIAQMKRHGIEDTGGKAAATNNQFLSEVPPSIAGRYEYFLNLLTTMKDDLTEEGYRRFLTNYLQEFLEVANGD